MTIDRSQFKATPIIEMMRQYINNDALLKRNFFDDYIENTYSFLMERKLDLEKEMEESKKNINDDEEFQLFYNHYEIQYEKDGSFNPTLFYNSVMIMLTSYLEIAVDSLASYFTKEKPELKNLVNKIDGGLIKKSLIIINEFIPEKFDPTKFDRYTFLRNKIVHENGQWLEEKDFLKIEEIALWSNKNIEIDPQTKSFKIVSPNLLYQYNQTIEEYLRYATAKIKIPKKNKLDFSIDSSKF